MIVGANENTVQEVRHLSVLHSRSIRALPAHNPRTGLRTATPSGLVAAATRESIMIIASASTNGYHRRRRRQRLA
jgi:hypothetical protein